MPNVEVIFFQEAEGKIPPLLEWLDGLPQKVRIKCLARLKRLEDLGHELRRPEADYLRRESTNYGRVSKASITECSTFSTEGRRLF